MAVMLGLRALVVMFMMLGMKALAVMFVMLGMKALVVVFVMLGLKALAVIFVLLGMTVRHTPPFLFTASLSERPLAVPSPLSERGWLRSPLIGICLHKPTNIQAATAPSPLGEGCPQGGVCRTAGNLALQETSHCRKPRTAGNLALLETSRCWDPRAAGNLSLLETSHC